MKAIVLYGNFNFIIDFYSKYIVLNGQSVRIANLLILCGLQVKLLLKTKKTIFLYGNFHFIFDSTASM